MPTYQIIKFEIPMHDSVSIIRQVVPHILNDLVVILMGSAQCFSRFDVFDGGLLGLDTTERVTVTMIESSLLAVILEPNSIGVKGMKPCESLNSGKPTSHRKSSSTGAFNQGGYHNNLRLSSIAW